MSNDVLCLRPQADFQRAGVVPPASLAVTYRAIDDPQLAAHVKADRPLGRQAPTSNALEGRHVAMLFEKASLRTRSTFEIAVVELGGNVVSLQTDAALGKREPVAAAKPAPVAVVAVVAAPVAPAAKPTSTRTSAKRAKPAKRLAKVVFGGRIINRPIA